MGRVRRIFCHVLGNGLEAGIGRGLVELVPVGRTVEAVETQETGILGEGAPREVLEELLEIGFGRIIILVTVVAESPVVLDRIVPLGSVGQHGHGLEQLRGTAVFLLVEVVERRLVLCVDVIAAQKGLILRLAGEDSGENEKDREGPEGIFHVFHQLIPCSKRKRSASRAALQPEAAAVTAWR